MRDSVGQYLHEIGLVPLLDAAKERELAQRIEAGRGAQARLDAGERGVALKRAVRDGAKARDHFIRANLRLVVNLARRYPLPHGMELLDLVQEGNLGLEHAVEKFDWRKGFKFSTYATFWIRQAIGRALDSKGSLVKIPGERSAELRAALRDVMGEGGDLDAELANLHRLSTPTSLDRTVGEDGEQELVDLLPDQVPGPEAVVVSQMYEDLAVGLLERLDPRVRTAVQLRFGLLDGQRRSFREVGEELGVTAEAARRMVKRAVDVLQEDAHVLAEAG
jgi:RNA polymerase primary sigma factor